MYTKRISFLRIVPALFLCSGLIGVASAAHAFTGQELAKDAKVSMVDARAIALTARPGKITDEEFVTAGAKGICCRRIRLRQAEL